MRTLPLLLSLFLFACTSVQKAPAAAPVTPPQPEIANRNPTVESFRPARPTLSVTYDSNLFRSKATDDEMVMTLLAEFDHVPGDPSSTSFEGDEGEVRVEISVRPSSEIVSPKVSASTMRMAYGMPAGWSVSGLKYDQDGTFGRFRYFGNRVNCPGDGECTATRPVEGFVTVQRLNDQPEYTLTARAEWHPKLSDHVAPQIVEIVESARIEQR